ncbi:uncharacterized protein A4U43_C02F9610 [Asparagus officinalis]|uniref:Uncharacterized protein n=1 Tax=Asparagus officinalis TaxID=4686 RepID=A0A5P1FM69_ASPOF|nr:uncharacterized protein A4U43_C02F9610 [Asparagus officinalis]
MGDDLRWPDAGFLRQSIAGMATPTAAGLRFFAGLGLRVPSTPVVNALSKQRAMLENILRACIGLALGNNMILEYK